MAQHSQSTNGAAADEREPALVVLRLCAHDDAGDCDEMAKRDHEGADVRSKEPQNSTKKSGWF